jgi:hypothetical protein
MTDRPDNPLLAHARECEECSADGARLAQLAARLDASVVEIDASRLSHLAVAAVAPELQARAQAVFWRRLMPVLGAALLPLPLLIAADWWLLARLYELIAAWLPSAVAALVVFSYAMSGLVLLGGAYAAIPLLVARPTAAPDAAPA